MSHHIDQQALTSEQRLAFKERKSVCLNWVVYKAERSLKAGVISECKTSLRACKSILLELYKASPTGDFCNVTQRTLSERSGYSIAVVKRAIKAMKRCGVIHYIHKYQGEGADRRRVASYTILAVFKKQIDKFKVKAKRMSVAAILREMAAQSIGITSNRLLDSFNKAVSKFQCIDTETGEVMSGKSALRNMGVSAEATFRGLVV